jgi:hypothetical protein
VLRRLILVLVCAGALAPSLLVATPASAAEVSTSTTESGSPINDQGSNYNYRSNVTGVTPNVPGLSLQVLEFADRLLLTNHTGKTVTVYGYQGEPYARVRSSGTVEVNLDSAAYYLNQSFYGNVAVPAGARNPEGPPRWTVIDRTGQFEWHDHRIHWMSPLLPPEVKNKSKLTKIFEWKVPIAVGATKGEITGQLFWTPESSKASVAVIVLGVVIVLASLLFVLFVRRRRARAAAAAEESGVATNSHDRSPAEVW